MMLSKEEALQEIEITQKLLSDLRCSAEFAQSKHGNHGNICQPSVIISLVDYVYALQHRLELAEKVIDLTLQGEWIEAEYGQENLEWEPTFNERNMIDPNTLAQWRSILNDPNYLDLTGLARTALPQLLDEVERLREALEYIAKQQPQYKEKTPEGV